VIDREYMGWIRDLPCIVCVIERGLFLERFRHRNLLPVPPACFDTRRTEAAHVGQRGIGQKCSDRETIPLCREHHREGKDSVHRLGKNFWQHHEIDRYALIRELQARYEKEREAA